MIEKDNIGSSFADAVSPSSGGGRLFVLSAPSGAGKTTISSRLQQLGLVRLSVSHTTRSPRGNEKEGEAYFFISEDEFFAMRDAEKFLEWAQVYGHYYGTSRDWVEAQLAAGTNVLLEIDCQGALQIHGLMPAAPMIFIRPPDIEALRQRLRARQQDDEITVARRLAMAEKEMAQETFFDHIIINDQLENAIEQAVAVIQRSKPSP